MKSQYSDRQLSELIKKHSGYPKQLNKRVYTSRLLGAEKSLVLHGGGNTSVKLKQKNIIGEQNDIIFVKASGTDLSLIKPEEFVGLNLNCLRKLRCLKNLSDEEMENQYKVNQISAHLLRPSVEALVHAFLPHKYIDHTHADSILTLTNQVKGDKIIKDVLGEKIAVTPYISSGFPLALATYELYKDNPCIEAIVIANHGIFTFADDARKSYETMIHYVNKADQFIDKQIKKKSVKSSDTDFTVETGRNFSLARYSQIIRGVCAQKSLFDRHKKFYVEIRNSEHLKAVSTSKQVKLICNSGVITPDHVTRTKNNIVFIESFSNDDAKLKQIVKKAVDTFKDEYHNYFKKYNSCDNFKRKEIDPYPRLFLVAGVGLIALGSTRRKACIAADIGEHNINVKLAANEIGEYAPISEKYVFDMEYWSLQQKKIDMASTPGLQGQVALVTGGAGAIGFGIAERLLDAGAVVVISDIDKSRMQDVHSILAEKFDKTRVESIFFDVTDYNAVDRAFEEISCKVGGIDIVVPNAGIAHVARIEDLQSEKLNQVINVNLMGTFNVIKASIPVFKRQDTGGNIVVISSKNVFDPGASFGAYSASKAGAHQISKIAALELAELGVRVNMVNPDAVFGDDKVSSKLWDLIGPERMKSRGLDSKGLQEYYRNRSLLKNPVLGRHVGNAVVFFASDMTPTTGASLPVDSGIPAAFPR